MPALRAFGDSIVKAETLTSSAAIIAAALNLPFENYGVNGAQVADIADAIYAKPQSPEDRVIISVGVNNMRVGNSAAKRELFRSQLASAIACQALPNKQMARDPSIVYSSGWNSGIVTGVAANVVGATATFRINGDAVFISLTGSDPWSGTGTIKIDNGPAVPFSVAGGGQVSSVLGRIWCPFLMRISGLGAGDHTVVVTMTGGNYIALEWVAGVDRPLPVYVANITRMSAAGYAQYGGSDSQVAAYNAIIASEIAALNASRLNVTLLDHHAIIDPATDLSDNLHWSQSAHTKAAAADLLTFGVAPTPPSITFAEKSVYLGSDGGWYVGDAATKVRIDASP